MTRRSIGMAAREDLGGLSSRGTPPQLASSRVQAERILALGWGAAGAGGLADRWLRQSYPALVLGFDDWLRLEFVEAREAVLWSSAVYLLPRLSGVERVLLVQPALAFHDGVAPATMHAMRDRLKARDWRVVDAFARQAFPCKAMVRLFSEQAMEIDASTLALGVDQLTQPLAWEARWSHLCSVLLSRRDKVCSTAGLLRFFAMHGSRGVRIVESDVHGPGDTNLDEFVREFWS